MDDDRPYWQRYYGFPRHRPARPAVRRLGLALLAAVVFMVIVAVAGWAAGEIW